jgi:hypothetical protein
MVYFVTELTCNQFYCKEGVHVGSTFGAFISGVLYHINMSYCAL